MSKQDDDFWRRFEELDRRRVQQLSAREKAFRQLEPDSADDLDPTAVEAWREYRETVGRLERSVAELERLVWEMK